MFNKAVRTLAYLRQRGVKSLGYKIYKKIMYRMYRGQFASSQMKASPAAYGEIPSPIFARSEAVITPPIDTDLKVSIILLFEEVQGVSDICLRSIQAVTSYTQYEIALSGYDSKEAYSQKANAVIRSSDSEYLIMISQPVEIIDKDWIQEWIRCLRIPGTGIAGVSDLKSWTPSCFMIPRVLFQQSGGFNEYFLTRYANADLCLRVQQKGNSLRYTAKPLFKYHVLPKTANAAETTDRALLRNRWRIEV